MRAPHEMRDVRPDLAHAVGADADELRRARRSRGGVGGHGSAFGLKSRRRNRRAARCCALRAGRDYRIEKTDCFEDISKIRGRHS